VHTFVHKKTGQTDIVLVIPTNVTRSTMAHEAIHAAWYILEEAGIEVNSSNHEALTYLVGFIIAEVGKVVKN